MFTFLHKTSFLFLFHVCIGFENKKLTSFVRNGIAVSRKTNFTVCVRKSAAFVGNMAMEIYQNQAYKMLSANFSKIITEKVFYCIFT